MKVENQKMWQLGFHRKMLNDLTANDAALMPEVKTEMEEYTDVKPDVAKTKKEPPKDQKRSIYSSDEEEPEPVKLPPKRFGLELKPGLNVVRSFFL